MTNDPIVARIGRSEKVWVAVIGAVSGMVGAALTYSLVAWFDFQNRDRELDLDLARMALSIIAGEYDAESEASYPARRFALDMLEAGTRVVIAEDLKEEWARGGQVQFGEVPVQFGTMIAPWEFPPPSLRMTEQECVHRHMRVEGFDQETAEALCRKAPDASSR